MGYVNKTGEVVIPFKYDRTFVFTGGLAAVRVSNKWGFVNTKGVEVIPPVYDEVNELESGKIKVKLNGSILYFDKEGKVIN